MAELRLCVSPPKNGKGDLVLMDIEAFTLREKMLKLREELLAVEEDRLAGRTGVTPDELDKYLDGIIDEVGMGKEAVVQGECGSGTWYRGVTAPSPRSAGHGSGQIEDKTI